MRSCSTGSRSTTSPWTARSIGDAETQDEGWTYRGFQNTGGNDLVSYTNAYFVDNRSVHQGLDKPLSHLYNFGFPNPDRVEFFSYNKGALISYWDASYTDNNVGDHPGHGEILPVDANPGFVHTPDGALMRPGFSSWDAAFSDKSSKKQTLRFLGQKYTLPARKAVQAVRRHPSLLVRQRPARCGRALRPLPARLVQRRRAADRNHDPRHQDQQEGSHVDQGELIRN